MKKAKNIKINLYLVSIKFFIHYYCSQFDEYNDNWICSLTTQIFTMENLQTTTVLLNNGTSHKADWILTAPCLLCLVFLYAYVNRLMNVLEVECSWLRLHENSITMSLLFVYLVHVVCCWFLSYFFIPFSFMLMVFISVASVAC